MKHQSTPRGMRYPSTSRRILPAIIALITLVVIVFACQKVEHPGEATGSLQDAKGYCLPYTQHGNFYQDASLNPDSSYVEITLNVASIGAYNIKTDSRSGVMFADSGVFTKTGQTTVRLRPRGTYVNTGSSAVTYPYVWSNTYCEFSVNVVDSSLPEGRYRFTAGGKYYFGFIYYDWVAPTAQFNGGPNPSSLDTLLHIALPIPPSQVSNFQRPIGTWPTTALGTTFSFTEKGDTTFKANPWSPGATMTIILDTVWPARSVPISEVYQGKFYGTALDKTGQPVPISGEFRALR